MKKAFTLIELIIVIVILGILTSVILPKLVVTRDDAKIAIALSEVGRLVSELTIFYTYTAHFDANLSKMSSIQDANYTVGWNSITQSETITYYTPKNRDSVEACMTISIKNRDGNMTVANVAGTHENVCQGLQQIAIYRKLLRTTSLRGNNIF